jgi:PBP1b-binding outer membrane lipoprotein LpoB
MFRKIASLGVIAFAVILSTGCASVQMASPEQDAAAKTFSVKPDKANIYVYRNETFGAAIKMPVALNGKLVGDTAAKTYMKLEVPAGEHTLMSKTENDSTVKVNTVAGKNYFVWQEVKMGLWAARSNLQQVEETAGREAVNECKLIESVQ